MSPPAWVLSILPHACVKMLCCNATGAQLPALHAFLKALVPTAARGSEAGTRNGFAGSSDEEDDSSGEVAKGIKGTHKAYGVQEHGCEIVLQCTCLAVINQLSRTELEQRLQAKMDCRHGP